MNHQLALAIQLHDEATLTEFCWGDNVVLQQQLQATLAQQGERFVYLWGKEGSGKSHLLQACCHAIQPPHSAIYLPLDALREWGPDVLEGIEGQQLISIDNIDAIAGDNAWEEALFHLYNKVRDADGTILLISGKCPANQLPIQLADLRSRVSWGLVMQVYELNDDDKVASLRLIAKRRGFELPTVVGHYLVTHCSRNMHDLTRLIDQLDEASLIAQRKITIPFVKRALAL